MLWVWLQRVGLAAAVLLPIVGAAGSRLRLGRAGSVAMSWVAASCAVAVTVLVGATGPAVLSVGPVRLVADGLSALVLVLVVGVGALVQSFSARYLQTDPSAGRFSRRVGVVVTAMAMVAASGDLAGLVAGWLVAGAGFASVLSYRSDLPGVERCVAAVRRALVVGDSCLVAAAAIIWARVGDVQLGSPHALLAAARQLGEWRPAVAVLLALAALARCSQGIFRRWLPLTVSAPTPACALLHAGVVNGGGVLLLRTGALATWTPAMVGLFVISGATAVWAGLVMARQADVKGQLAFSTMSQMGFMLAECAVGAYPAAVVHLVGHGCYKASLFFSSGSTVARPGRPATRTGPTQLSPRAAAAAAVPGLLVGDGTVLALFAAVTATSLAGAFCSALPAGAGGRRLRWTALLVMTAGAYGATVAGLGQLVAPALGTGAGTISHWWLLSIAVAALAFSRLVSSGRMAARAQGRLFEAGAAPLGWDRTCRDRRTAGAVTADVVGAPELEPSAA